MSTVKLYDIDAYRTDFTAKVVSCERVEFSKELKKKVLAQYEKQVDKSEPIKIEPIKIEQIEIEKLENIYQVILDQTLFFPEEGGQSPDKGILDGQQVLDVQIEKNVIIHTLRYEIEAGKVVEGTIDWKHRFYNMQQHSGEHIFSGLVHTRYGFDNVGFHLSDSGVTMDFNGVLTEAQIKEIEYQVNEAITQNIELEITYPDKETLATMEYRSKIVIDGQTRIVTIPGYDRCACCAPHVKRTGEIGILKVVNIQNYKSGIRVSILCGFRALADYEEKVTQVSRISALLSAKPELVSEAVEKMKADFTLTKQQLIGAKQELIMQKIQAMPEKENNPCLFEKNMEALVMRTAVNTMVEKYKGYCAVFTGTEETGYQYMIGIRQGDARIAGNQLKIRFQAKGGGKPEMIQGSLIAKESEIRALLNTLGD